MSLKVTQALPEQLSDFLRLTEAFYKETPFYPSVQYSSDRVKQIFDLAIQTQHDQVLVLMLQDQQKVCGLLVGIASKTPFSDDWVASELARYIEPEYRGNRKAVELVEAYEEWARQIGCKHVSMALLTTLTDASKFYERRGYKKTEISFLKELD